jgi:hypothetical protein
MQALGVAGETLIWWQLPAAHAVLRGSLLRFILFDGGALVVLCLAAALMAGHRRISHGASLNQIQL